jgi:EpsG family
MLVYAFILIPTCLILTFVRNESPRWQRLAAYPIVALITFFAALRGSVGTDTAAYRRLFDNFQGENILEILKFTEPVFVFLIKISSVVSDQSSVFISLVAFLQGILLIRLISKSNRPADFLAIYISIFYINFEFNILRSGVAILFLLAASQVISEVKNRNFYFYGTAAVFSHYTSVIGFLPMVFLRGKSFSEKVRVTVLMIVIPFACLFLFTDLNQYEKYLFYINAFDKGVEAKYGVGFFVTLLVNFLIYLSFLNKKNAFGLTFLFLTWAVFRWASNSFLFVDRVAIIFQALYIFSVLDGRLTGWKRRLYDFSLIGLVALSLYGVLTGLEEADRNTRSSAVFALDFGLSGSPYIPYKFFWDR